MLSLNYNVQINLPYMQQHMLSHIDKKVIAVIISYTGDLIAIKEVIERLKKYNVKIIAITSINNSYLKKEATYCLTVCSKETINNKIESYSSKLSGDLIIDLIFSALFKKDYELNLIKKAELERGE